MIGTGGHNIQNGEINVSGTSVVFNGSLDSGPQGKINVTGGGAISLDGAKPSKGTFTPAPAVNQPTIPDPLAGMTMPVISSLSVKTGNACSSGPGIYNSFNIPNVTTCTLSPGLYVTYGTNHVSSQTNIEAVGASRARYGAPDWQVEAWVSTYTAIAAGDLERLSDDVARLTGRRPLSVAEFLAAS